jgi:hypothetical protein
MTGRAQPVTPDAVRIVISSVYRRTISVGGDQAVIEQTVSVPQGVSADAPTCAGAQVGIRAIRVCQTLAAADESISPSGAAGSGVHVWTTGGPYLALFRSLPRAAEQSGLVAQPHDATEADAMTSWRKGCS